MIPGWVLEDRSPVRAWRESQGLLEVVGQVGVIGVAELGSYRREVCRGVGPGPVGGAFG
jgi:hypothetical protein